MKFLAFLFLTASVFAQTVGGISGGGGLSGGGGVSNTNPNPGPLTVYFDCQNGNDSNSGDINHPFLTPNKARLTVRGVPGAHVVMFPSTCWNTQVHFDSGDSGTPTAPIVWQTMGGPQSTYVISGGVSLPHTWTDVSTDTCVEGSCEKYTTTLTGFNKFIALFYNGERRYRPRTTNGTYLNQAASCFSSQQGPNDVQLTGGIKGCNAGQWESYDHVKYNGTDIANSYAFETASIKDVEFLNFERWSMGRLYLQSQGSGVAVMTGPELLTGDNGFLCQVSTVANTCDLGHRFLIENCKPDADAGCIKKRGNWTLDRTVTPNVLTYWANPGENPNVDEVIVPQQSQLMTFAATHDFSFTGFTFSHDDFFAPAGGIPDSQGSPTILAAVQCTNCINATFDQDVFIHIQGWGVSETADAGRTGTPSNFNVTNGLLWDIGGGAVRIGQIVNHSLDTDSNVPNNNTVENNLIGWLGLIQPTGIGTGVWIGNSHHNKVLFNEIHDLYTGATQTGYSLGITRGVGNAHDNEIGWNLMYNLGKGVTDDFGCSYWASSQQTGNSVHDNVCHDITHAIGDVDGYGGRGIYFDQGTSNLKAFNNLIYRFSEDAFFANLSDRAGGDTFATNNSITNNVFAWSFTSLMHKGGYQPSAFDAEHNIFQYAAGNLLDCPGTWGAFDYQGNPVTYLSRWTSDNNDYFATNGTTNQWLVQQFFPIGQTCTGQTTYSTLAAFTAATGEDAHSVTVDPQFVDSSYPADNYNFKSTPPAGLVPWNYGLSGRSNGTLFANPAPEAFPTTAVTKGQYGQPVTNGNPPPTITTMSMPNGTVGTAYSVTLGVTGGTAPFTWTLQSGSLPNGLSLNSSTGTISGTPTVANTFSFTVMVTDFNLLTDSQPLTILINPATVVGNLAELPRAYPDINECAAPVVTKNLPGDFTADNAGITACLAAAVADGRDYQCKVAPGSNLGQVILPVRPVGATSCIAIRSSVPNTIGYGPIAIKNYHDSGQAMADDANRFIVESLSSGAFFGIDTANASGTSVPHHYIIDGVLARPKSTNTAATTALIRIGHNDSTQTSESQAPHDIFVTNFHAYSPILATNANGLDVQRAFAVNGDNLAYTNGVCENIHMTGTDTQCFAVLNGQGPIEVQNVYLAAGAEPYITGGSATSIVNEMPCDQYFHGNYVTRDLSWYQNGQTWNIKNSFELKTGCRVLIEGNILENSWINAQTGGCFLWNPRANGMFDTTVHDVTARNNILRHCEEAFDAIGASSDGAGNGNGPSLSGHHFSVYNNLWYDIANSRFKGNATSPSGKGLPIGAPAQTFGADSATVNTETRTATGATTVVLASAPPQIVSGLKVQIAGSTNGFDGLYPITSVLSTTQFVYQGPASAGSSTGGTATLVCTSTSDGLGNITTSCPDTACGTTTPCGGGFEIGPGEWVKTQNCSDSTFNTSQAPAVSTQNVHSLTVGYVNLLATKNSSTSCQVVNHQGTPQYIYFAHNAVYGRDLQYNFIVDNGGPNLPHSRNAVFKDSIFTSTNTGSLGIFTGGKAEGTGSELAMFDVGTIELHNLVFQGRTPSKFTEWLTSGGSGITPPTTIFGPAGMNCGGTQSSSCIGTGGDFIFPDPDAGGNITSYTGASGTATVTFVGPPDLRVGDSIIFNYTNTSLLGDNGAHVITAISSANAPPFTASYSGATFTGTITGLSIGTFTSLTSNDTPSCSGSGVPTAGCNAAFTGLTTGVGDTNAQTHTPDPAPGNVSSLPVSNLFPNFTGQYLYQFQPWWCNSSSPCNTHLNIGMDLSNAAQVHKEVDNMIAQGMNGTKVPVALIDFYGFSVAQAFNKTVTDAFFNDTNARCSGGSCSAQFAIELDEGAVSADTISGVTCPKNGGGISQATRDANCQTVMNGELDQLESLYCNVANPVYAKYQNKCLLTLFITPSDFTNPAPNFVSTIYPALVTHSNGLAVPFAIFDRAGTFPAHGNLTGLFLWPQPPAWANGSPNTQCEWDDILGGPTCNWTTGVGSGSSYINNAFNGAIANSQPIIGVVYKGFDSANAPWLAGNPEKIQQGCGTLIGMVAAKQNAFMATANVPFLQLATVNDYEEGTELETGVDNCVSAITASISTNTLSWTLTKTDSTFFNASTIKKFRVIINDASGQSFLGIDNILNTATSVSLSGAIPTGTWNVCVQMIGQPFIINKMSNCVSYTASGSSTSSVNYVGSASTGHDYHDFALCQGLNTPTSKCLAPSFFWGGQPGQASDGTMMGPDFTAIDNALVNPNHP